MQILHAGRYAYHPFSVAPSALKSPITPFKPRALGMRGVEKQIRDFVDCALRAQEAGYDGVEIMGSEGYFINEFLAARTNKRDDDWGGDFARRMRLPVEIVRRSREAVGRDFILIYRLSMLDLVERGSSWEEVVQLAKAIEAAGASLINTGIGWHEARIPTIATRVPRAAFSWVTARLKQEVKLPLIAVNRINMPEVAERVLAEGQADMVSMARPLLADPEWVKKAASGRADEINTCIACNQACLDHIFENRKATCLVNPRACREEEFTPKAPAKSRRIAVVGAGPAGLAAALSAAERGHAVTLFDAASEIGGQFNMAKRIPGKEEFHETLRYFRRRLELLGVRTVLGREMDAAALREGGFEAVVMATGVRPRVPSIPGLDHPKVLSYVEVLLQGKPVGPKAAIVGAGGIGFDVAEFLVQGRPAPSEDVHRYLREWGVDERYAAPGGLMAPQPEPAARQVWLLQRSPGRPGRSLGKTTGWAHRASLKAHGVQMLGGVEYERIDDAGLHLRLDGVPRLLEVDNVVICAGQESRRELHPGLAGMETHVIGGARLAGELDAKRAIEEGTRLGLVL
jgi:2,4-dienoyl-CoA reductase (NADPH2)